MNIHFGTVDQPLPDWREGDEPDEVDDEALDETPEDVVQVLGFDPLELETDEDKT